MVVALALTLIQTRTIEVRIFVLEDCPIARQYAPEIKRLQATFQPKGVRFTLVHVDPHTTDASAKRFAKAFGFTFGYLLDPKHKLAKAAGVQAVPTASVHANGKLTYVGRIDNRYPELGVLKKPTRADLRIAIEEILAGKPITEAKTKVIGCVLPTL